VNWRPRAGWSVLAVQDQRHEAEFLAERLRDAGIPAEIFGDDRTCLGLGLQLSAGVAVYVNDHDLPEARVLLAEGEA
jgi:hypothetical protein